MKTESSIHLSQNRQVEVYNNEVYVNKNWYVLWTRSNCELNVNEDLADKNYEVFLPMIKKVNNNTIKNAVSDEPMFRSYLFVRHEIDKTAYLDISNTKGVVSILGRRWDQLAIVPDEEIATIKKITETKLSVTPYPYIKDGTKVKIINGAMKTLKGILIRTDSAKGKFIISVNLMQRSIAIDVNYTDVIPI